MYKWNVSHGPAMCFQALTHPEDFLVQVKYSSWIHYIRKSCPNPVQSSSAHTHSYTLWIRGSNTQMWMAASLILKLPSRLALIVKVGGGVCVGKLRLSRHIVTWVVASHVSGESSTLICSCSSSETVLHILECDGSWLQVHCFQLGRSWGLHWNLLSG